MCLTMWFSWNLIFILLRFAFVYAQLMEHLCPLGGMLNNFNQNESEKKVKCFFLAKLNPKTKNPLAEGKQLCRNLSNGQQKAKLAQPETPVENEIMRSLLQETHGSSALIGIVITMVENYERFVAISFMNTFSEVVRYKHRTSYDEHYKTEVGEVGKLTKEYYSYFLQDYDELKSFDMKNGKDLCTLMLVEKGNWIIRECRVLSEGVLQIMCESRIFSNCKLKMSPCKFNTTVQACTTKPQDANGNEIQHGMCPPDVPIVPIYCECCNYTGWSEWTGCGGNCYQLKKVRFRIPLSNSKSCNDTIEIQNCPRPGDCIGCKLLRCDAWSGCSKTCDNAVRTRKCVIEYITEDEEWSQKRCDQEFGTDEKTCDNLPCDQNCVEHITNWSACTEDCGFTGKQTRTVTRLMNATGAGLNCTENPETQNCPEKPCPIDCEFSPWVDEHCDRSCGNGTLMRKRNISRHVKFDGNCSNEMERVVQCLNAPCINDCKLGAWLPWEPCLVTCGAGQKQRIKEVIKKEDEWGNCSNEYEKEKCDHNWACPTVDVVPTDEPETLSSAAKIIYVVSALVAIIILGCVVFGALYYVKFAKQAKEKVAQQRSTKQSVKQAMQEILGSNQVIKEKKTKKWTSKSTWKTTEISASIMSRSPSKTSHQLSAGGKEKQKRLFDSPKSMERLTKKSSLNFKTC